MEFDRKLNYRPKTTPLKNYYATNASKLSYINIIFRQTYTVNSIIINTEYTKCFKIYNLKFTNA